MTAELLIAGIACFVLAAGHTAVGLRWVLPDVANADLHRTPFGPPSMTMAMLRFTWFIVTVFVFAFGVILVILAAAPDADTETVVLRGFGLSWLAAAGMATWNA